MRKTLFSLALIFGAFFAVSLANSDEAGAAPVPCPLGDQGWYMHHSWAIHCAMDGNHIAAAWYNSAGQSGTAYDIWLPTGKVTMQWLVYYTQGGSYANLEFCPAPLYNLVEYSAFGVLQPYWDARFKISQWNGGPPVTTVYEGVIWHNKAAGINAPYGQVFYGTSPCFQLG